MQLMGSGLEREVKLVQQKGSGQERLMPTGISSARHSFAPNRHLPATAVEFGASVNLCRNGSAYICYLE